MNLCVFTGRLVSDPDLQYTPNGTAISKFKLAIDRPVKKGEEKKADFPQFKAFGKTAEFSSNYLRKGKRVSITSQYQTGSFDGNDGTKHYTNEFIVDKIFPIDWPDKESGETENMEI